MERASRLSLITATGLIIGLLGMLTFSQLHVQEQHKKMREIYHDNIPQLFTYCSAALWELRHSLANEHGEYVDGYGVAKIKKKFEGFKKSFAVLNSPAVLKVIIGSIGSDEHLQTMQDEINRMAVELEPQGPFTQIDIERLKKHLEPLSRTLLDLKMRVQAAVNLHIEDGMAEIEKNDQAAIHLFIVIMLTGTLIILFMYTESQRAQKAARIAKAAERKNALFSAAIKSVTTGIVITDPWQKHNPIIFVNEAFTIITGYEPHEALGKNCEFLQGAQTAKEDIYKMAAAVKARYPLSIDVINYRKDGQPFWNALSISPVFDEQGKLMNFIGLQNDVSAIRETQAALLSAKEIAEKAMAAKSDFLATMSHETRTPISGAIGALNLLDDTSLNKEQKRLVHAALTSGQTLLEIVNDILDFSKIEAGKLDIESAPFDLPALVTSAAEILHTQINHKGLQCHIVTSHDLPQRVIGDPNRIRQVLLNLISNAVKFTHTGSLTIKVNQLMAAHDHLGPHSLIRFEVIDTGIGISPENISRLFAEFDQLTPSIARKHGGTGLGLAISKRLVSLMGGEIGVESRLNEGSKFWFLLPLSPDYSPISDAANVSVAASPQHKAHILLAEDNETNQLVISSFLRKAGHHVDLAPNGIIATQKVQSGHYDMVLMDVSMPEMDGFAATKHIRAGAAAHSEIPIIALTALTMPGDREKCLAAGMNDYIIKPVQRNLLLDTVARWLGTDAPSSIADHQLIFANHVNEILDAQVLSQLANDLGHGMIKEMIGIFSADLKKRHSQFTDAIELEDWPAARDQAHSIKSSSANCGLLALAEVMDGIETAIREHYLPQAKLLSGQVEQITQKSLQALAASRTGFESGHTV